MLPCDSREMEISLKNDWPGSRYNQLVSPAPRKFPAALRPPLPLMGTLSSLSYCPLPTQLPPPLLLALATPLPWAFNDIALLALSCPLIYPLALPILTIHPHPCGASQMIAKGLSQRERPSHDSCSCWGGEGAAGSGGKHIPWEIRSEIAPNPDHPAPALHMASPLCKQGRVSRLPLES